MGVAQAGWTAALAVILIHGFQASAFEPIPGATWQWRVSRGGVAPDQVLFFMQSGGAAPVPLEDWIFSLAREVGATGDFKGVLVRKDLAGRDLERREWKLVSRANALFWMDRNGHELPVLELDPAPPLAQPAERISCRVRLFEDHNPLLGLCAGTAGGVLQVAPGPLQFTVRTDPAADGSGLLRGLVTLFTAGLVIPGASNRDETAYLSAYASPESLEVPPSMRKSLDLFWRNPGAASWRELWVKYQAGGVDFVTAAFSRIHDEKLLRFLAQDQVLALRDPRERLVLIRFVLGRLSRIDAQLVFLQAVRGHFDINDTGLEGLRASVFVGIDETVREVFLALLNGRMPVVSAWLSNGQVDFEDPGAWKKVMPVLRSTANFDPAEGSFLLQYLPKRFKAEAMALIFSRASEPMVPKLVAALLSQAKFDDDRLSALAEVLKSRPTKEHAQILKIFHVSLNFDEGRLTLLERYRKVCSTLSVAEREEFARAVIFKKEQARKLLGL